MADTSTVQVALRIRPLVPSEISKGCKSALDVITSLNQVRILDSEKAFSYNYVFGSETNQEIFYNICVQPLIKNLFKGYNVTILAYGQTGSGKTHSMGTAYKGEGEMGVIPRAVNDIFDYVKDNFGYDFTITVSFMELYQEILYDLLSLKPRDQCVVEMREDINKGIFIPGLTEQVVNNMSETLDCLLRGSQGRATASTNMNAQSSRSHAIFTITLAMQKKGSSESKTAKFHLVDLAGSERSKKTGATGQTLKEGININRGLLALGNVISALGDDKGQPSYISYRDSNLTRLLKDSLGGNSITLMIACVSPADYNVEETVSTLRYADRARKIKNKPVVNEDPKAAEINRLNKLVQQLRLEIVGQGGPIICQEELSSLKNEIYDLKSKNRNLTVKLSSTITENTALLERVLIFQASNECMSKKLNDLKDTYDITLNNLNVSLESSDVAAIKQHVCNLKEIQSQFTELDKEQKKNEDEIKMHEITVAKNTLSGEATSETEINERQESHTAQQIAMNYQLQEVTRMLAQKEMLAQKIADNNCHMVDFSEMAENEAKIMALQKEKDELLQQLNSVKSHGASSKIAEQRRRRVQELEGQLHDLNRKVQEQARLIKLKEKDEIKIRQLNNEIQSMKSTKVKLIKSMRQESDNFRTWKIQRERELSKLKDQDRKRLNQIAKMETKHSRQQNVLKRKVEEAAAINKRLKDALALRKAAQDTKMSGKIERFGPWVQRELDVFVSTVEATATLETLIEDRGTLQHQLESLKASDDAHTETKIGEIHHLEDDIELRSAQIQEIQQKILDSDEENKCKTRFDNIQTMGEAKYTLKALFELTAEIKKKEASKEFKLNDLQSHQSELVNKLRSFEERNEYLGEKQRDEISKIQSEYEEKISVLLKRIRGIEMNVEENAINENIHIQEFERMEQKLENVLEENSELRKKVEEINKLLEETKNMSKSSIPLITTPPRPKRPSTDDINGTFVKKAREDTDGEDIIFGTPLRMDTTFEDDDTKDPDWRKTPLAKRLRKMKSTMETTVPTKRSISGGCSCSKTDCSSKMCGCRKFSATCNENCKCNSTICINKGNDENKSPELQEFDTRYEDNEEVSFKKPRSLELIPDKLGRKTRKLYTLAHIK
ncbi:PREDICTED: chromosome-associated kinesin KIF4 [Nicrophorus vespilloides]|uniref:Chromosome-associated kinesin KIF4 n=1 Tax=Nicrophorus vespilloides TaxID=110193 RepID=A0ABM1MLP0_NICVS|nr:PREDICTED: chromosome-associated kinesin KIF4 [Nicrophorus vespilloides]